MEAGPGVRVISHGVPHRLTQKFASTFEHVQSPFRGGSSPGFLGGTVIVTVDEAQQTSGFPEVTDSSVTGRPYRICLHLELQ